jgi:hypothetical protein
MINIYASLYIGAGTVHIGGITDFSDQVTFDNGVIFNSQADFYSEVLINGYLNLSGNLTIYNGYQFYANGSAYFYDNTSFNSDVYFNNDVYFDGSQQITFNSLPTTTSANMDANNAGVFVQSGNVLKQMTKSEFQTWLNS